jgi:hypothetical protein
MSQHASGLIVSAARRNSWFYNVVWSLELHPAVPGLPTPLPARVHVRIEFRDIPALLKGMDHVAIVHGEVDIPGVSAGETPIQSGTCHVGRTEQGMGLVAVMPFQGADGLPWLLHVEMPPAHSSATNDAEPAMVTLRRAHGPVQASGSLMLFLRLFLHRLALPQGTPVPARSVVARLADWWTGK